MLNLCDITFRLIRNPSRQKQQTLQVILPTDFTDKVRFALKIVDFVVTGKISYLFCRFIALAKDLALVFCWRLPFVREWTLLEIFSKCTHCIRIYLFACVYAHMYVCKCVCVWIYFWIVFMWKCENISKTIGVNSRQCNQIRSRKACGFQFLVVLISVVSGMRASQMRVCSSCHRYNRSLNMKIYKT